MNENCIFIVVQLLSQVWLFTTLRTAAHQASLSFTISQSLLQVMSTESVMPSSHLILCCPLLLLPVFSSIKSFPMSQFFALGGQSIWASASVLPMNIQGWYPLGLTGLISLVSKGKELCEGYKYWIIFTSMTDGEIYQLKPQAYLPINLFFTLRIVSVFYKMNCRRLAHTSCLTQ